MACFSAVHLTVADGWSATRAPAWVMAAGNFFLK